MTPADRALTALTADNDRHTAETLDMLRALAGSADLAKLDHHQAAVRLEEMLHSIVDARTLANSLANLLLQQVRQHQLPPVVVEPDTDPDLNGVEVRVLGPEPAARKVLARFAEAVALMGFRGPAPAEKRPEHVRFYAYTDPDTRNLDRTRHRARRGQNRNEIQ